MTLPLSISLPLLAAAPDPIVPSGTNAQLGGGLIGHDPGAGRQGSGHDVPAPPLHDGVVQLLRYGDVWVGTHKVEYALRTVHTYHPTGLNG